MESQDKSNENIIDPETGELIRNLEDSSSTIEFKILASKFKKGYLESPRSFLEFLDSKVEKEPLFFSDKKNNKKFVVEFFPRQNLLGNLGEWYRDNLPDPEDVLIIKVINKEKREFEIVLDKKINPSSRKSGLYLGKEYNVVGSRRYELTRDYFMPTEDLLTHVFICGITGSGKTVLGKVIIEEAARQGIPSILIDLKGDLSSLALLFTEPEEIRQWLEIDDEKKREEEAVVEFNKHYAQLSNFNITKEDILKFKKRVSFKIFTPRSNKGIPLGFSSPLGAPPYPTELYKTDREFFNNLVASLTNAFIDRLYPGVKKSKIENERNFIYEIVHYCWLNGYNLYGKDGLLMLLKLIKNPPFKEIGGLSVSQYIDAENRRNRLLNKVNTLLSGAEKMWFEGEPLSMDLFVKDKSNKTRVNIINLTELDNFEDRSFVVSQLAYEINKWMRKLPGTTKPRLIFFIDEVGGGGGKQALFPSFPYECAAKWGLNYLVRQGRSFGVCCIFSTQNPGDVDYKGLSNCHTWIIGKLATDRDRRKVLEGMEIWGSEAEQVRHMLVNPEVGAFVIKDPKGRIKFIKERWLMSYHRVLTMAEITRLVHS
ncbi:MAG: hypothetical protein B6D55_04795 [Candidatus Omnitrophica bacterium 4484_70.2]|nr:MAG: hypothetical protein B6D55_04795 [Candidatus Omnitrophica bacterium 4484_70.2]